MSKAKYNIDTIKKKASRRNTKCMFSRQMSPHLIFSHPFNKSHNFQRWDVLMNEYMDTGIKL